MHGSMNIKLKKWLGLRWQDYCYHSWLFLLIHTTMHGSMNIKLKKWLGLRWQDYCNHMVIYTDSYYDARIYEY